MRKNLELLDKGVLEGYNLRVLRLFARKYLSQPSRDSSLPKKERDKAFEHWRYTMCAGSKCQLIEELPVLSESMKRELDELQQGDILRGLRGEIPRKRGGLTEARRKSHRRYHREVVSPRRKATRHFMAEHPDLVAQVKEKYGLA